MSWGLEIRGNHNTITLSDMDGHHCYTYSGLYYLTNERQTFSSTTDWVRNWSRAYTHTLQVTVAGTPSTPPLVFVPLIAGSYGDWQNNQGTCLLRMDVVSQTASTTTWKMYFVVAKKGGPTGVRIFERIPQDTLGTAWGLQVRDSFGDLLFDSSKKSLWMPTVKTVSLARYTDSSYVSGGDLRPKYHTSLGVGSDIANYSVMVTNSRMAPIANSSSFQGIFGMTFQYSGSNLLGTWTPIEYAGGFSGLTGANYADMNLPLYAVDCLALFIDNRFY